MMLNFMTYIGSYLAILLLLMPASMLGIVQISVLSVVGVFLIIWKKPKLG